MSKVILDADLMTKLHGLSEPTELCDVAGQTRWRVIAEDEYQRLLHHLYQVAEAQRPALSQEEIQRRRQTTGSKSLADILRRLGAA